ncbi:MAG: tetratricopeptide repeat protein, partial [Pseudomonadota bacterium]
LDHWEHFVVGRSLMFTNAYEAQEQAIRHFERAVELDPGFVDAIAAISITLSHQRILDIGRPPVSSAERQTESRMRALALAHQAIEMNEKAPTAWLALSKSQFALGDFAASMRSAKRALSYNPNLGWGHHMVGLGHCQMNQPEDAVRAFDEALITTPQDYYRSSIMAGRALALLLLKMPEEALECARTAQLKPQARCLADVVEICALSQLGHLADARYVIERVKERIPRFGVEFVLHRYLVVDENVRNAIVADLEAAGLK